MAHESHSISLGIVECYKLLFKNKKCPTCSQLRKKIKRRIDFGEGWHKESNSDDTSYEYGQKYEYEFVYRCENCEIETPLGDI